MAHFPKLLCPACHRLETMPCDANQGLPPCGCPASGHGPCKQALCLACLETAIAESVTSKLKAAEDRRKGERRR